MPKIFSIEGNIGSGKSTFLRIFKETQVSSKIIFAPEPVSEWESIADKEGENILEKYYKDNKRYAFSFQVMAFLTRYCQLRKLARENPDAIIITERCLQTDKHIFAQMLYDQKLIDEIDYRIYSHKFDEFAADIPISGIIYVNADAKTCHQRIAKRDRKGETIPLEYLEECGKYHNNWITGELDPLVLDANGDLDETKGDYYSWIAETSKYIKSKL